MRNERELKGRLHVSKKIIIHLHFHVFDHPLLFSTLKHPILYSRNKTIGQIICYKNMESLRFPLLFVLKVSFAWKNVRIAVHNCDWFFGACKKD